MIALSRSGSLLGRVTSSERTWHTLRTLLLHQPCKISPLLPDSAGIDL